MTTLIIICAVILILGSSLWILPSPRQRAQMQLRREAMMKGLQVKLTKVKDLEFPGEEIHCIAYRLQRQLKQVPKNKTWMLYRHNESNDELRIPGWLYDRHSGFYRFEHVQPVSELLAQLPEDVIAVEGSTGTLSIYWNEKGDSDDLATILRVLTEFQAL